MCPWVGHVLDDKKPVSVNKDDSDSDDKNNESIPQLSPEQANLNEKYPRLKIITLKEKVTFTLKEGDESYAELVSTICEKIINEVELLVESIEIEGKLLVENSIEMKPRTVLIVLPTLKDDFEAFLEVVSIIEETLESINFRNINMIYYVPIH